MQLDRRTFTIAALGCAATPAQAQIIARTRDGRVRGAREGRVLSFKGVRYGQAPMRFARARPPGPWRGVRDAFALGPSSPQSGAADQPQNEDCFFLNVWTPSLVGRRAVMVYIHGGAYSSGSASTPLLNGARLAERGDVVVVTLNHRLGPLGYAYLPFGGETLADSGNAGQLDLILALEWVRDNIAAFGGDADCVTLFGQSGGGAKIATLMAMPAAARLFHRAATMSGQQITVSGPLHATQRSETWLTALGLDASSAAGLHALALDPLLAAARASDPILGFGALYFGPVLDERSIHRHPFYPDAAPQSLSIPMLLGNTHDETRGLEREPALQVLTWDELPARLARGMRVDIEPNMVVREYRRMFPAFSPSEVFFAATTAARSWRGQIIEAEERARAGAPAYVYQLDWRAPAEGGRYGAPHTLDIPLVFGTLEHSPFVGARSPDADAMSAQLMDSFVRFAKTGDPGWPPYSLERRETMIFDRTSRLDNDPRRGERELFAKVPYIQPGT
jgi:para-nitrobenzyl esterase